MELSIQLPYFSVLVARLEAITDQERIAGSIFHAQPCDASWKKLDDYHCKTGSAQAIATMLGQHDAKFKPSEIYPGNRNGSQQQNTQLSGYTKTSMFLHPSLQRFNTASSLKPIQFWWLHDHGHWKFSTSEVEIYLEEKVGGAQVDLIEWWRIYESRFPNLSRMTRDYSAIPATSVPSERYFRDLHNKESCYDWGNGKCNHVLQVLVRVWWTCSSRYGSGTQVTVVFVE